MGRLWALREARLSADARSLGAYAAVRLFGEGREEGFPRFEVLAPRGQSGRPRLARGFRSCSPALRGQTRCAPGTKVRTRDEDEKVGASEL